MPYDRVLLKLLILFVSSGLSMLACTLPKAGQPQPTDTLSVTSTIPANGDSHVDPGVIITVVFNEAVDVATLMGQQGLVQITPLPPSMDLSLRAIPGLCRSPCIPFSQAPRSTRLRSNRA